MHSLVQGLESNELWIIKETVPSLDLLQALLFHQLLVLFAWSRRAHTSIPHSLFIVVFQGQILDRLPATVRLACEVVSETLFVAVDLRKDLTDSIHIHRVLFTDVIELNFDPFKAACFVWPAHHMSVVPGYDAALVLPIAVFFDTDCHLLNV